MFYIFSLMISFSIIFYYNRSATYRQNNKYLPYQIVKNIDIDMKFLMLMINSQIVGQCIIMLDRKEKTEDSSKLYVEVYNLPEHGNKEDIVFFLWKALENCRALIKHTNPIVRADTVEELGCIRLFFRSREETLNCLDLNGILYGEKAFYMKSPLASRTIPQVNPGPGLNLRRFNHHVEDTFNRLCITGFPPQIKEFQIVNFLSSIGQLKAFQPIMTGATFTHSFFEYHRSQDTENCLSKLHGQKLKGKTITIKRGAFIVEAGNKSIGASLRAKSKSMFQKDIHSHFLTFDTVGFFQSMKISCVLLLKNIISSASQQQLIKEDIRRQVSKIGPLVRLINKDRNIYLEYQRVEYAQICYLLLMQRKYDGKNIDISFYDPLSFAEDKLI